MSSGGLTLPPSVLDPLIQTFVNINASRYTCAAGLVVILYDWFLTFPSEVDLIWRCPKGLTSVLFLVNRYVPIPFILMFNYQIAGLRPDMSNSFCRAEVMSFMLAMGIALTISTWLLSLRVTSLWHRQQVVVYSVYFVYFLMQAVTWTLTAISIHKMYPTISYYGPVKVCGASSVDFIGGAYFAPISFELYVFILQVVHHYRHARVRRGHNLPTFALLNTLYNDGYTYFGVIVGLRLMTCLVWATAPGSLWYMSTQLELAMTVTLTSRFHLHLRQAAAPEYPSLLTTTHSSDSRNHHHEIPSTQPRARLKRVRQPRVTFTSGSGNVHEFGSRDFGGIRVERTTISRGPDEETLDVKVLQAEEYRVDASEEGGYEMKGNLRGSSEGGWNDDTLRVRDHKAELNRWI